MRPLKLAAYLDEAGEDPKTGCATLKSVKIPYIALRHVWASNICNASDQSCQTLKKLFRSHDLTVIMIASELGQVPANELPKIKKEAIDRVFDIASYFGASYIRIYAGDISPDSDKYVKDWLALITERSISANVTPLLEVSSGSSIYKPVDIVQWFSKFRRWKLLYDPAQLILKQSQDPFVKYWTLLKQYVGAIDIHDYKIGHGHKPVGFGDTKIQATLNDANASNFTGWHFLEPALGRKHGSALTRTDTFKTALGALEAL